MDELAYGFNDLSNAAIITALGSVVGLGVGVSSPSFFGLSVGKEVMSFCSPLALAAGGEDAMKT